MVQRRPVTVQTRRRPPARRLWAPYGVGIVPHNVRAQLRLTEVQTITLSITSTVNHHVNTPHHSDTRMGVRT